MEVHAHTQTERKKWTHYFWEFLMLFLAVFCGFLAEYQLEHVIENRREKQYIRSLIEDLKQDTAQITAAVNIRLLREKQLDSLIRLLKSENRNKFVNEIYYFARYSSRQTFFFVNADRTIQQLKHSGGLRLIRNQSASDNIMSYDASVRFIQNRENIESTVLDNYRNIVENIFDASVFQSMIEGALITRPKGNLKLFNENLHEINRLCIQAHYLYAGSIVNRGYQADMKNAAEKLIVFLKKEYHLE